jgi:hypothetical protein
MEQWFEFLTFGTLKSESAYVIFAPGWIAIIVIFVPVIAAAFIGQRSMVLLLFLGCFTTAHVMMNYYFYKSINEWLNVSGLLPLVIVCSMITIAWWISTQMSMRHSSKYFALFRSGAAKMIIAITVCCLGFWGWKLLQAYKNYVPILEGPAIAP